MEIIMKEKLQKIREDAIRQIEESGDLSKLNDVRVAVLGKKGELTAVLKSMKDVSPEERPLVGQLVNETRESIEKILDETKKKLEAAELDAKLRREVIDVTLPAKKNNICTCKFCSFESSISFCILKHCCTNLRNLLDIRCIDYFLYSNVLILCHPLFQIYFE